MQKLILFVILLSITVTFAVNSALDRVTVFPDRATVVRNATVNITGAGEHEIEVSGIPNSADPSTVRLSGSGTGGLVFGAVQMTRDYMPPDSGRIAEIEERLKVIEDELQALTQRRDALNIERSFLTKIGDISAGAATFEIRTGDVDPQAYRQTFDFMDKELSGLADKQVELAKTERDLKEERTRLQRERNDLGYGKDKGYIASFTIKSKSAGKAAVELSYTVWQAGWIPSYDARSISETGKVEITYYGEVRQRTGEDWNRVKITLSTSRPSLGASAPELEPWYLNIYEPYSYNEPSSGRRGYAKSAPPSPPAMAIMESMDDFDAEAKPIEYMGAEAVQSGGGSVQFDIPGRVDIPMDNSLKKLQVGIFEFDAKESYICVPKLAEHAFLRAKFENESDFPFLAGKVAVFQGQDYVGDSRITFVAPGEEIELSMGVSEAIKIERKLLKDFAAKGGLFGSKRKRAYAYRTEITNNLDRNISIEIFEQIPVPSDSRIKLNDVEYIPEIPEQPERGLFSWKIDIPKGKKATAELRFIVEYPKDLEIEGL